MLVYVIVAIDTAQLIGAICVIQPWTQKRTSSPKTLCWSSAVLFVAGGTFFTVISLIGQRFLIMMTKYDEEALFIQQQVREDLREEDYLELSKHSSKRLSTTNITRQQQSIDEEKIPEPQKQQDDGDDSVLWTVSPLNKKAG